MEKDITKIRVTIGVSCDASDDYWFAISDDVFEVKDFMKQRYKDWGIDQLCLSFWIKECDYKTPFINIEITHPKENTTELEAISNAAVLNTIVNLWPYDGRGRLLGIIAGQLARGYTDGHRKN